MKIRYAEVFDAFLIAQIHCNCWQKAYANLIPQFILQKRNFSSERVLRWENRIKAHKDVILVAENNDGKVVAFAWGGKARDENIFLNFELYALYVDDACQNLGYGSALIKAFANEVKEGFYLFALKGNEKAYNFYIKKGGILKPEYAKQQEDEGFVLEEDCFFFI